MYFVYRKYNDKKSDLSESAKLQTVNNSFSSEVSTLKLISNLSRI